MTTLKVTCWNIEHMSRLFDDDASETQAARLARRRAAIAEEIRDIDPDVLCILEGPSAEAEITAFCQNDLAGEWTPIFAGDGDYATRGSQFIWFLVRTPLAPTASLLPVTTYKDFAGASWKVNYWGDFEETDHRHFRHPQTLVLEWMGERVEFIGAHLKSKFVFAGRADWNAGGERRQDFIRDAIKARIKLTTEALNIRAYIDRKFAQRENPCIFVMGDLNDGPGKEFFETQFLFFDLLSNIQGDVFFARRFLNHALFDFPEDLRWTVKFQDFITPERDPHILLDHIMFTQSLVNGSKPFEVASGAGKVEHEIHELVNAGLPGYAETSDHRPVSVLVTPRAT